MSAKSVGNGKFVGPKLLVRPGSTVSFSVPYLDPVNHYIEVQLLMTVSAEPYDNPQCTLRIETDTGQVLYADPEEPPASPDTPKWLGVQSLDGPHASGVGVYQFETEHQLGAWIAADPQKRWRRLGTLKGAT